MEIAAFIPAEAAPVNHATLPRPAGLRRISCAEGLLKKLAVDVNDPKFWELGLQLLGEMVTEAEKLAGVV